MNYRRVITKTLVFISFFLLGSSLYARRNKVSLPKTVRFAVYRDCEPDDDGYFTCRAVVAAPICDVKLKLNIEATDGIAIVEKPKKLKGRLRRGKTATFEFMARLHPNARLPIALRMELLYRSSPKGLRKYISAGNGEYAFHAKRERALSALERQNTRKIESLFDCVLFTANAD